MPPTANTATPSRVVSHPRSYGWHRLQQRPRRLYASSRARSTSPAATALSAAILVATSRLRHKIPRRPRRHLCFIGEGSTNRAASMKASPMPRSGTCPGLHHRK
jgi:hypothetical protein